ncbi:MAG: HEAT repeat domain-containing protein [Planctomycetaceae bacterium]|jgi:hypothetical protein|nr:HEAT repeat domain-containing protein [Planctomycetaceae bacterium]
MKTNQYRSYACVFNFLTVGLTVVILGGTQFLFAQEQEQDKTPSTIREILKGTLTMFGNDEVFKELMPVIDSVNETEIPDTLLNAFIVGTKKIDALIPKFTTDKPDDIAGAAKELEKILNELDVKATLIFVINVYSRQTDWKKTGAARMWKETTATINALKAVGLERPASQIDNYRDLCFSDIVASSLKETVTPTSFENDLNNISAQKKKSNNPDGSYSENSSYESLNDLMSPSPDASDDGAQAPKAPPKKLTWTEQAAMLCRPGINAEQVMSLCELLADSMDSMVTEKRQQMQLKKQQFVKTPTSSISPDGSTSDSYRDMSPSGNSPSDRMASPNVTTPLRNIPKTLVTNLANRYFDVHMRVLMACNLKQAVLKAKGTQQITLLKAWCVVSDDGIADIYGTIALLEEQQAAARQEKNTSEENRDMMGNSPPPSSPYEIGTEKKTSLLELITVFPNYKADPRVLAAVLNTVQTDRELATQLCFNIGGSVQTAIKPAIVSPMIKTDAKIALIRALQYIGRPDASDSAGYLLPLLKSKDSAIVEAAADAISEVGDRRASATLIKGLKNPQLADIVKSILKKMGSVSQNDIITQFQEGDQNLDEICIEILGEGGDINALDALAKVLRRYHNAESKAIMLQKEKTQMLILTMQAGLNIISRNMGKNPPELIKKKKPTSSPSSDLLSSDSMTSFDSGAMVAPATSSYTNDDTSLSSADSYMSESSSTGESGQSSGVASINQLKMTLVEVNNDAPYEWLNMVYIVAAKHLADTAEMMEEVRTANSGKKIGEQIHDERVSLSMFKQSLNTSEEGLTAYLTSKSKIRSLLEQKGRVKRSLGQYQSALKAMSKNKSAYNAFSKALTGVDPNASTTNASGTNTQSTQPKRSLGSGF